MNEGSNQNAFDTNSCRAPNCSGVTTPDYISVFLITDNNGLCRESESKTTFEIHHTNLIIKNFQDQISSKFELNFKTDKVMRNYYNNIYQINQDFIKLAGWN